MGLLHWLEREVVKRLRPFLAPGCDARLKVVPSASQLLVELRDVSLDVAAINDAGMSGTSLHVHEVVVEDVDLRLSLLRFPVVTVVVRGLHVVVKPRSASEPHSSSKKTSKDRNTEAAREDSTQSKGDVEQGKGAAVTSFLINSLVNFALSSLRLEFHECSVKFVSHSLKRWSYIGSASLESLILQEGSAGGDKTADGLFQASLDALRSKWERKVGSVEKVCILNGLALNLETVPNQPNDPALESRESSGTFQKRHRNSRIGQRRQNRKNSVDGCVCMERDQILLFEVVSVAVKLSGIEFLGLVVDVPEVFVGLDAGELNVLMVLAAQANGAGVRETDKALDMVFLKVRRSRLESTRNGLTYNEFGSDLYTESSRLEEIVDPGNEAKSAATRVGTHQEGDGANSELEVVRVPAHRVFPVLGWRLWVHSLSEVVGFASHILFVILLLLRSVPALVIEAWQWTVGKQPMPKRGASELPGEMKSNPNEGDENLTTATSEGKYVDSLFKAVDNRGPTFEIFFGRGLFTLVCTADGDMMGSVDETAGERSKSGENLDMRGVPQPGVHMTLERVSLEYGLDHIGSGGRVGVGHWQVDLISVVASHSLLQEDRRTLRQGRWKKTSDTLQLLTSMPYRTRMKANVRCRDMQDIGDAPLTATARKRHYDWQGKVASSWSQHVWKCAENLKVDGSGVDSPTFKGDVSRAFLIAEFGTADVDNSGVKLLGGLITCALSMGCLDFYSDSTTSYRIRPLIDQLSITKTSGNNAEPDDSNLARADPKESVVSYEEIMLHYLNLIRHYIGLAVPKSRVELSVVIESSMFTFAAIMGQFEGDHQARLTDSDGNAHSSRGSSLVVEIGSVQLLTWPASTKEVLSEIEASVPMKDAAPLGWWDECVDEKVWLKRPPTPSFPADTLGSEEEQVGNNLYFALEDAGVMLRTDRNRQTTVPVLGPISCVMQSSFCRDDLYSQSGVIKSAAVALEGNLAPFSVHLYLEEMAIFQEIVDFGNALMEGFGSSSVSDEEQPDVNETSSVELLRKTSTGRQATDVNVTADVPPKIMFVLSLGLQLEAFQFVLGDRRIGERENTPHKRSSSSNGRQLRNRGGGHGAEISLFPGQGRYCYFATLPILLDMSLGDGYETRISFQLDGAHMGVVKKQLQKAEQQQSLYQSLVDGTVLDVTKLFQIVESGFALDPSKIAISGPRLIRHVKRHASMDQGRADAETHLDTSLLPADGIAVSSGKDSAFHKQMSEHGQQIRSMNGSLPHDEEPDIELAEHNRSDEPHWLVVNVDIGSISVADDLREALIDKVEVLVSGSSTLHLELVLGKDLENVSLDVEGGLAIIQTTALHSLFEYINDHVKLLSGPASSPRSNAREFSEVLALQRSNNADGPSPLSKSSGRSTSLPPWVGKKSSSKMRRLVSAPRRLQAATELMPEVVPKKGYDGNLSANLVGLSLVLVQRGSTTVAPVEGFLMEVDTKGQAKVKSGNVLQISAAVSRASMLGLQGRTFGRINSRSSRTPQFRNNFNGASNGELGQGTHRPQRSYHSLSPSSSGMSEDEIDEQEWNGQPFVEDDSWKPLDESHSYILERLSVTASMEKVPADKHPDFWKWRNSWKGSCSVIGLDFAITTSEVQLLLSVTAPLSGLSSSSSSPSSSESEYEFIKSQAGERGAETLDTGSYLPDGAVIAIKDMNEHYYLAVEEKDINSGTFRLVGALHYSLVGDRALFKVKYHRNKSGNTNWFSLLSLHANDSNGQPFRVHFQPGSGQAEVATTHDNSSELWEAIETTEEKSEGSEELGFQISRRAFHLINQKSKSGLSLVDGSPMLVKRPGSSFKLRILAREKEEPEAVKLVSVERGDKEEVDHGHEHDDGPQLKDIAVAATVIPNVTCDIQDFTFTLLHEASGGMHLLPLVRLCMRDIGAVLQLGSGKTRVLFGCSVSFDFFQAQNSCWVAVINPIGIELLYRSRNEKQIAGIVSKMTPVTLFCRLRKVDIIISEMSLDTLLFLIGALDLAGPYTLGHSPVLANRCQVENQTGIDLVCRFDHGKARQEVVIESWGTDAFLIRHTTSRRDLSSAEVASSVDVYLQKHAGGRTSAVKVSLTDPGVVAMRTRLQFGEGHRNVGPGPILVVDVLRQSQGGVSLTVSPMVRISNATGIFLELQCRRPKHEADGAVVLLEDGDTIDDCMGSFDALNLEGEIKRALTSFNVGNFLLSIRPASGSASDSGGSEKDEEAPSAYDWSEDVKGAKAVRVSNLFEKFQHDLKRKIGGRNSDVAFGTVFCRAKRPEKEDEGLYFLIRSTKRHIPLVRLGKGQVRGKPPVASRQEQQELLLLPTIRIFNLFTSNISAKLFALAPGRARGKAGSQLLPKNELIVNAGKMALMYVDLGVLSMVIKHLKSGLTSNQVPIFGRDKKSPDASMEGGGLREAELDVDFGDGAHCGKMKVRQDDNGVLEVVLYTKYALFNDSHVPLLYCAPKQKSSYLWRRGSKNDNNLEWPSEETVSTLQPGSRISWFNKSSKVMMKQVLPDSQPSILDLDNLVGSTEISLKVSSKENADQRVQLGVELQLPAIGDNNPTRIVHLAPRYIVVNRSNDVICVCQDGFQSDMSAIMELNPGEKTALHCRVLPDESDKKGTSDDGQSPFQAPLSVRFRSQGSEWDWSGPVCAAALGTFWIKIRRQGQSGFASSHKQAKERMLFALAEVQEDSPSLTMSFRRNSADAIPYRIENALLSGALLYNQKGLTQSEVLEAGATVNYVWDDLSLTHKLVVTIQGTQLCQVINVDKIREWKRFGATRRKNGFAFQLPFTDDSKESDNEGDGTMFLNVGYEVVADGPTRVLRICLDSDSNKQSGWQSTMQRPKMELEVKVPLLFCSIVEPIKQPSDASADEKDAEVQSTERRVLYAPIVVARATNLLFDGLVTDAATLAQLKVERLDMDVKWQGSTVVHMLRVHGQNSDDNQGQTVLHMAIVVAHRGTNPIQLHYASLLLQAADLNIDEDTLMKFVPFYRTSLAPSTGPSRLIYYERFEIHPIKILASYTPGKPRAHYTSAQETLRALLHTVIKVPAVRGFKVELNGVLLSNALLTYAQLAVKIAQHYSWYAMRAVYIARGSSLLPPAFASLFDDSAASSLDVFFDPSNGSVDVQGLTLGMFNILSKGLRKKGHGGSSRLLGDVEHTVKAAGSNLLFAVVTEVSDSVLKGAEASGLNGLLSGFRRGILNVAMRPAVLRSAVASGGSTRRIKLDHSVGMDEDYIGGYLQAMLDTTFRQDYLKVKVTEEEVLLKNLPPNTALMEEMLSAVKKFLIAEGLLTGESSLATARPTRRLQGDNERRLGPALIALCEQLLVVIAVQGLRKQTKKHLHFPRGEEEKPTPQEKAVMPVEEEPQAQQQEGILPRVRFAATNFVLSSGLAYLDGRLCRHIPNTLVRRIVSGFLLSFVE